jgi:hypothetical protein
MTICKCDKCEGTVNTDKGGICDNCGISISTTIVKIPIPIFKFRPPSRLVGYGYGKRGLENYGIRRYAGGKWILDDGKYDMAFIGYTPGGREGGAPIYYGVDMSSNKNGNHSFHPNSIAYRSAGDICCAINGCASGKEMAIDKCEMILT